MSQSHFATNFNWIKPSDITLDSRAYRYGDGFFESMLFHKGKLLHSALHWERIIYTAKSLFLELPVSLTQKFLETHLAHKVEQLKWETARVRLTFLRHSAGNYTPNQNKVFIITEITDHNYYQFSETGLKLCTYTQIPKPNNFLSSLKTCNALPYVLASVYAYKNGADAALIINNQGNIAEAQHSNVFIVLNNTLITPHLDQDCIDGVMRKVVLQLAQKLGISIHETSISTSMLNQAQEVFLSNASQGIQWAASHQTSTYQNTTSKKVFEALINLVK